MSQKDVYDLSSPSKESIEFVQHWLTNGNAISTEILNNGGFIRARFSVRDAVAFFSKDHPIKFNRYKHQIDAQRKIVRCAEPIFVPAAIHSLVDFVDGVNNFPCKYIREKKLHCTYPIRQT
mgnify:CR=1 FL=1